MGVKQCRRYATRNLHTNKYYLRGSTDNFVFILAILCSQRKTALYASTCENRTVPNPNPP